MPHFFLYRKKTDSKGYFQEKLCDSENKKEDQESRLSFISISIHCLLGDLGKVTISLVSS